MTVNEHAYELEKNCMESPSSDAGVLITWLTDDNLLLQMFHFQCNWNHLGDYTKPLCLEDSPS